MQTSTARAVQAYQTTHIQTQSPLGMVALLYAGAIRFMKAAAEAIERHDMIAKRDAMSRAMAIVAELQNTLNMAEGGEVARSLDCFYSYVTSRLLDANVRQDPDPLRESIQLMSALHEAWATIASPAHAAAQERA
jgi:flagellar secretion chaperone FliS